MNLTLTALTHSHRHGDGITLHLTEEAARDALAEIARLDWWEIRCRGPQCPATGCTGIPANPATLDRDEAIAAYFAHQPDESYSITACDVEVDLSDAAGGLVSELRSALAQPVTEPSASVEVLRGACRSALRVLIGSDR